MRNPKDVNAYINFALYAVLGKMAEADGLLERHAGAIRRVAAYLAARSPVRDRPLYRGMLLDPERPLVADARRFWSWSEDLDVACWFASRGSVISGPLAASDPRLSGAVLELASPRSVLFHHSWAREWDCFRLAAMHPHMGVEGAQQIDWSLRTQREVITEPLAEFPVPRSVDDVDHLPVAELDRRLAPPWMDGAP